jgi:hypothetical protein
MMWTQQQAAALFELTQDSLLALIQGRVLNGWCVFGVVVMAVAFWFAVVQAAVRCCMTLPHLLTWSPDSHTEKSLLSAVTMACLPRNVCFRSPACSVPACYMIANSY